MSYHPIMGIAFFFTFLVVAFILGKRLGNYKQNKNNIIIFDKKKNNSTDAISPDANWID